MAKTSKKVTVKHKPIWTVHLPDGTIATKKSTENLTHVCAFLATPKGVSYTNPWRAVLFTSQRAAEERANSLRRDEEAFSVVTRVIPVDPRP